MNDMTNIVERLQRIETLLATASKEVLNANEAALFLGISTGRLYHLTAERAIPHYKKNGSLSFRKSELEDWLLGERVDTKEEIEAQARAHIGFIQRNARSSKRASKS